MSITPGELSLDREDQERWLPDTATIQRATDTRTAAGGTSQSWTSAGTASCRLSSRGVPREYLALGAQRGAQYWMVTLPHDADVTRKDRLVIGARTLEVVGFASGGAWETALRAVCVEVS
jgi:head-tail adaptor